MSDAPDMIKAYEPAEVEAKLYPIWENSNYFHSDPNSGKKP